jgi:hypothetical protein
LPTSTRSWSRRDALHVVTSREITRFLPPQLQQVPGTGNSRGAHVPADPALTLADADDRARQVNRLPG